MKLCQTPFGRIRAWRLQLIPARPAKAGAAGNGTD